MKRYICLTVLLSLVVFGTVPAADGDGGYAAAFLQVPIGARPAGMGGAYTAVSNDGAGILYNPAGIVTLKKLTFATSYRAMTLDRKLGYATLLFPVEGEAVLGFHWLYAGSGSVQARDGDGYVLGHDIAQNSHDFSAIFSKRFEKFFSVGTKINYYHQSLSEMKTSSVGFDFGAMLYVDQLIDREKRVGMPIRDIQVGLTVKYVGVKFPWNSEKYNIVHTGTGLGYEQTDNVPFQIALGTSARVLKQRLLLAVDLIKNENQGAELHAGAEYMATTDATVRGGFSDGRITAGAGYIVQLGGQTLAIDYAFSTEKADEGSEHIFSFDLLF